MGDIPPRCPMREMTVGGRRHNSLPPARRTQGQRMTDDNYTGMLLIVDRSGSMETIRDDMVGGLDNLLKRQAAEAGLATVDIVIFDDEIKTTHVMAAPAEVEIGLEPRGTTALNDALWRSIVDYGARLAALPEHA